MTDLLTLAFLLQILRITVPYVLAALGGTLSERSGVVNLALEGILLTGAFTAALGAKLAGGTTGVALAAVFGVGGGVAMAALYAVAVLRFRADQIVAGVAVNLLAIGLTRYFLKLVFHTASSSGRVAGFEGAGTYLFVGAAAVLALLVHVYVTSTPSGLRLRAVGEHPDAAASLGVDVIGTRLRAILASGVLAGLGGAWLLLSNHEFTDRMSNGRGYIALAAMIFGNWRPGAATLACLLFGFADALQLNLQATATSVPREFVQILPYVLTMVTLAGVIGRSRAPAALGRPWP